MRFRLKVAISMLLGGIIPLGIVLKVEMDRIENYSQKTAVSSMQTQIQLKGQAVESFFGQVVRLSQSLAARPDTVESVRDFASTARDITGRAELVVDTAGLIARYGEQAELTPDADPALVGQWMSKLDETARRLQQIYIVANPEPLGDKDKIDDSKDGSTYSALHSAHHAMLRQFKESFGFYDLFLIEPVGGRIVYTVEKETDFGTSLLTGPFADTAFGHAAKAMIEAKGQGAPYALADFEPYAPSYGEQAAFILFPIWDNQTFAGILAFQLPLDFANLMLQGAADGKESSDTYIVGSDRRLRSIPRFADGLNIGSTVESEVLKEAIAQGKGVISTTNHLDVPVLAAFRPLDLPGVDWRIISEISRSEALAEAEAMRKSALYSGGLAALLLVVLGLLLSGWLLRPLKRLGDDMQDQATSAIEMLRSASVQARSAAETMASTAAETSRQTKSVLSGAEQMSSDVRGVASSVDTLSGSISGVVKGIVQTSQLVEDTAERAELARKMLNELETVATRITGIVTLIHEVANQTNLLSLNAAIEASHAGSAGRGFAVVAAEIRKLATRTTDQTEEIASEVRQVLSTVSRNAEVIRSISLSIGQVNEQAHEISVSADQQGGVTLEIAGRMAKTAERVAEASSSIRQVHSASTEAASAAADMLGGVQLVESATDMMNGAMSGFVQRVHAL